MTFKISLPDEEAILHIEAQTDDSREKPMPLRMLAYASFLALQYERHVYSTVLYFRPPAGQSDPGFYGYGDDTRGGLWFKYTVIRMYELEGEGFLDTASLGLLPFTPLMKPPAGVSTEAWIEPGAFSFTYFLYMRERFSAVGASCARDIARKP